MTPGSAFPVLDEAGEAVIAVVGPRGQLVKAKLDPETGQLTPVQFFPLLFFCQWSATSMTLELY